MFNAIILGIIALATVTVIYLSQTADGGGLATPAIIVWTIGLIIVLCILRWIVSVVHKFYSGPQVSSTIPLVMLSLLFASPLYLFLFKNNSVLFGISFAPLFQTISYSCMILGLPGSFILMFYTFKFAFKGDYDAVYNLKFMRFPDSVSQGIQRYLWFSVCIMAVGIILAPLHIYTLAQ